jgi:hypothetical protein
MDKIESELQAAAAEFLTILRQGRGPDEVAANRMKRALRAAANEWANSDMIPKSAANLFIDLASGIESCSCSYSGEEANRTRVLADEVADLVRACVAVT